MRKISKHTKIFLFLLAFTLVVLPISLTHASKKAYAFDGTASESITYEEVKINRGDTITGIAEKYYDASFGSFDEYVDTICTLNRLKNKELIHSGNYLIIPIQQ